MHFYKEPKSTKTQLSLEGNLILSANDELISSSAKSRAPHSVVKARYIQPKALGFFGKLWACVICIRFIFGGARGGRSKATGA